jgi:hypothetical protein
MKLFWLAGFIVAALAAIIASGSRWTRRQQSAMARREPGLADPGVHGGRDQPADYGIPPALHTESYEEGGAAGDSGDGGGDGGDGGADGGGNGGDGGSD